jgi:hypothetical protein
MNITRRNLSQSLNMSQQKRSDNAFIKMMLNPNEPISIRHFHDTISNAIEKKQVTSQRSQTTLEQSDFRPGKNEFEIDRRHAVTASLNHRIKVNKELTDTLRKGVGTRVTNRDKVNMADLLSERQIRNTSMVLSNRNNYHTISPNYLKLYNQPHQQKHATDMYMKYVRR